MSGGVSSVRITEGLVNKEDDCYQSSRIRPDFLLPGFTCSVNVKLRNELLGIGSLQHDGPKSTPLTSAEPTAKRKRDKKMNTSAIVSRRVDPKKSMDDVEQPVYIVQDGDDRLKGRTITINARTGATSLTTEMDLLAIPYVDCCPRPCCVQPKYVSFGLMSLRMYKAMVKGKQRATRREHNAFLKKCILCQNYPVF